MENEIINIRKKEEWVEEVVSLIHSENIKNNLTYYLSKDFFFLMNKGYNEGLAPIEFIFKYL